MTNGFVRAVIRAGNRIYIGGRFTSVRGCAPGTSCPGSVVAVNNVAAFDAETGAAIPSFKPEVTGETGTTVYALAVLGGKLFIGGKFTSVDGQPRLNFAAVDAISGGVDAAVDAQIGSASGHYVRALLAAGDKVFVGGVFGSVDGVARARLAAFNVSGELDLRWRPRADASVASLALACDGQTIFVGGNFRRAAGSGRSFVARETLARFDLTVGNIQDWQVQPGAIPNGLMRTISRLGSRSRTPRYVSAYSWLMQVLTGPTPWTPATTWERCYGPLKRLGMCKQSLSKICRQPMCKTTGCCWADTSPN